MEKMKERPKMAGKHYSQEPERKPWGLYILAAILITILLGFGGCIAAPLVGIHLPSSNPEVQRLLEDSDRAIQESEEFNENAQELIEFLYTCRTLNFF